MKCTLRDVAQRQLQQWIESATVVVNIVAVTTMLYRTQWYWSQPYHTSALTGQAWVEELMRGYPK
jgi:hypothetical protein